MLHLDSETKSCLSINATINDHAIIELALSDLILFNFDVPQYSCALRYSILSNMKGELLRSFSRYTIHFSSSSKTAGVMVQYVSAHMKQHFSIET